MPLRAAALCLAVATGAAQAAAAQIDLPEALSTEGQDLTAEEWRALTDGRTVWYSIGENLWGRESYRGAPGEVTFQFPDGECLSATWTYQAPWFCFDFGGALGGAPHCFRHIRFGDQLWALARSGEPQRIDRIDGSPISCGPDLSS